VAVISMLPEWASTATSAVSRSSALTPSAVHESRTLNTHAAASFAATVEETADDAGDTPLKTA